MEAISLTASLIEVVKNVMSGIRALEEASRNMEGACEKVEKLEGFLDELTSEYDSARVKHSDKLHHGELESLLKSFEALLKCMESRMKSARKVAKKAKKKGYRFAVSVVISSIVGDPLTKIVNLIALDLEDWLKRHDTALTIRSVIDRMAGYLPSMLKVYVEPGYPLSEKVYTIREMLEREDEHPKVVLVHGLSGIGKSCLARQVAADPPRKFKDGAIELPFGPGCRPEACGGDHGEYQRLIALKFGRLLGKLGYKRELLLGASLDQICDLLQEFLKGRSLLILLDDVWEPDIISRLVRLTGNNCKYLATTRNQLAYEFTGALKVEIRKEDTRDLSQAILLFHSQLSEFELPADAAKSLMERCGFHPLTLAVMGKAFNGETNPEVWYRAVENLRTYAEKAPVPVLYLSEDEVVNAVTVFGSFEFSLKGMTTYARDFFYSLAALTWVEPIPEKCLEAVWVALNQKNITFLLVSLELVGRSLLGKSNAVGLYQVHDMVTLYLQNKTSEALQMLTQDPEQHLRVAVAPWLLAFGCQQAQVDAVAVITEALKSRDRNTLQGMLSAMVEVICASKSITELEAVSVNFSRLVGPMIPALFCLCSEGISAAVIQYIANCFTASEYAEYSEMLRSAGLIDELAIQLKKHTANGAALVLIRLMELGSEDVHMEVLVKVPINELVDLIVVDSETELTEEDDMVINVLLSLAKVGKEEAVEKMFRAGIGEKLHILLCGGDQTSQNLAVNVLKSLCDYGGSRIVARFIDSIGGKKGMQNLPWKQQLILERIGKLERQTSMPTQGAIRKLVRELQSVGSEWQQAEVMQKLDPVIDKARDPNVRCMLVEENLIESLAKNLHSSGNNRAMVESANALMRLGCLAGGEISIIKRMIKAKVVEGLVNMMNKCNFELQEVAYGALHNLMGAGKQLITEQILKVGLLPSIISMLRFPLPESRKIGVNCVQDLVQFAGKACIEQLLTLQVVENLHLLSSSTPQFHNVVIKFIEGVKNSPGLSRAEHNVLRQQLLRRVRASVKNPQQLASIMAYIQSLPEGSSKGGSSSRRSTSHTRRY